MGLLREVLCDSDASSPGIGWPGMETVPHKKVVRGLIALGTVLTVLAIFAVWADRQALNTDEWVNTSGKLLENQKVKSALSEYLVNEL